MRVRTAVLVATLAGLGCAWQGTPVPVTGELVGLTGEWEGTYASVETGRSGTLSFKLDATTDSAFGDVWMGAPEQQYARQSDAPKVVTVRPRTAEALTIAFVRAEGGRVSGRLEVYRDPTTGERLFTQFDGVQRGDEFRGSYQTRNEATGRVARGDWTARRVGSRSR
ncbi:MAG TPA: hypothetical protein VF454_00415 [Gemmatimonadales bacterium]